MDRYVADLHIHSRFSRATSKNLTIRNLAAWGRVKGIDVLGTGDFTHPEWLAEMEDSLVEDGSGLLSLKDPSGLENEIEGLSGPLSGQTRFLLQSEISSIYKRGGKVRKIHNLVYLPTLDAVKRFNLKLGQVGNLASDGRPILGLDSRNLLELVLETDPLGFLVPAHIWTPWFALFGSKSGFDSVEECYGDLSSHIFAMETGLSSDPEMNWTWSALDRFRLISNSDAHSGEKLGREANLFQGEVSYEGLFRALRGEGLGQKFRGTLEFFPEEGKYHLDGHRKCNVVLDPQETRARGGICPVCGKPVTLGVLSRISELADRDKPERPAAQPGFVSLIPLKEIMGEVVGQGPNTKKVAQLYSTVLADLGPELQILRRVPVEDIRKHSEPLAEGISRMREGQVIRTPGFDGQYGVISVFTPRERAQFKQGGARAGLIDLPDPKPKAAPLIPEPDVSEAKPDDEPEIVTPAPMAVRVSAHQIRFNPDQLQAIEAGPGPVLVLAGPGTGKTQTLMGRLTRLMDSGVKPRRILALTFTRRAARELKERLTALRGLNPADPMPQAGTIHALAFDYWKHAQGDAPVVMNEETARRVFALANPDMDKPALNRAFRDLELARERMQAPPPILAEAAARYIRQKASWNLADYADLLEFCLEQMDAGNLKNLYSHVLVDEVQDLTRLQLTVVTGLAKEGGRGFFAIGDPLQSIYAFRGAEPEVKEWLTARWPDLATVGLTENYRSGQLLLDASSQLFLNGPKLASRANVDAAMHLFEAPDAMREASWISERVKKLIGATSHSLTDATGAGELAPGEVAVLVRFSGLIPPLVKALKRFGVPCAAPETEAFWSEPRVAAILAAAGRILGLAGLGPVAPGDEEAEFDIPESVLAGGPSALSAHLAGVGPFDDFFWESKAFNALKKEYKERGGWAGLLNWVNLQSELDQAGRSAEKVQVMSLHAAKGLEFEAVFLPALEEGILPFAGTDMLLGKAGTGTDPLGVEEERRLFYVGMTRAKRLLYLSRAARRQLFGRTLNLPASRFLGELPQELLSRSTLAARTVRKERQISLLD